MTILIQNDRIFQIQILSIKIIKQNIVKDVLVKECFQKKASPKLHREKKLLLLKKKIYHGSLQTQTLSKESIFFSC